MNERIKQIAEQAGLAEAADVRGGYIYPAGMEKFVELIIKECSQVINQIDADDAFEAVGLYRAESALGKHFGVEL